MDYEYLKASDGTGDAALMHVEAERSIGATTIEVDIVTGVPDKFIGSFGTLLPTGFVDAATIGNFYGHLDGSNLEIDGFLPGTVDDGNSEGQVVIIKPNTFWSNKVAEFILNATDNGTPINVTFADLIADALTAESLLVNGNATIQGDTTFEGNVVVQGTSNVLATTTASGDGDNKILAASQAHSVTALAAASQIGLPTYSPTDRMSGSIRIKDNGTARALTWSADWVAIGVTLPTTTVINKYLYISYEYCLADSKFHVLGIARQA